METNLCFDDGAIQVACGTVCHSLNSHRSFHLFQVCTCQMIPSLAHDNFTIC